MTGFRVGVVLWLALQASVGAQELGPTPAPSEATPQFLHFNGMDGRLLFPEMTGQGGALFDYDNDGDLDAYFVQGRGFAGGGEGSRSDADPHRDVLLRNDATREGPRWVDVTEGSALVADGYGMAVAVGDIDDDGWRDLFVGNYGVNQLWRNRGDGSFENVTELLGTASESWTTGAAFVDLDGDTAQDLYVVNYVGYETELAPACYAESSRLDYCGPSGFAPEQDRHLHNDGDGGFRDVTAASGLGSVAGAGLGVAVLDAENDGQLEVYVANDGQPNFLWRAVDGRWIDDAPLSGVAVNRRGEPEASMGIAIGDFDRDGDEDVFLTHLDGESNTLYVSQGNGLFDDRTTEHGLAASSLANTSFGVTWTDLDHDGWLDLAVVNGAVRLQEEKVTAGMAYPLSQPNQLFRNLEGSFTVLKGEAFSSREEVSRGLVDGDIDNDGDRDLLVTNNAGPARLFLNRGAQRGGWFGISLVRPRHESVVARFGGWQQLRRATPTGSYASSVDPRALVTGDEPPLDVTVSGPARTVRFVEPPLGSYLRFDLQLGSE